MFGLMRPHHCSVSVNREEKRLYRFYYCGICKTIASRYGQKMRLFLNHDIIFFAEILAELSGESQEANPGNPTFYSANCFVLPHKQDRIPLSFSIAAAVNILLAKLTINDKVEDSQGTAFFWKWMKSLVSRHELNAIKRLKKWEFPVGRILSLAYQQKLREQEMLRNTNVDAVLDYFSEPTAVITGIVFQHAAKIIGKKAIMKDMYALGFQFGQLIYLLDAWEDFERDNKKGNFNALAMAFNISDLKSGESCKSDLFEMIRNLRRKIIGRLSRMPITMEKSRLFSQRLSVNLKKRLRVKVNECNDKHNLICTPPDLHGPCRGKRWELDLVMSNSGLISRTNTRKFTRYLHFTFFVFSIPIMFGLRFIPFTATSPVRGKTKSSGNNICSQWDCCDCCDCNCCDGCDVCDCDCCDGCDVCDCNCCDGCDCCSCDC